MIHLLSMTETDAQDENNNKAPRPICAATEPFCNHSSPAALHHSLAARHGTVRSHGVPSRCCSTTSTSLNLIVATWPEAVGYPFNISWVATGRLFRLFFPYQTSFLLPIYPPRQCTTISVFQANRRPYTRINLRLHQQFFCTAPCCRIFLFRTGQYQPRVWVDNPMDDGPLTRRLRLEICWCAVQPGSSETSIFILFLEHPRNVGCETFHQLSEVHPTIILTSTPIQCKNTLTQLKSILAIAYLCMHVRRLTGTTTFPNQARPKESHPHFLPVSSPPPLFPTAPKETPGH